MKELISILENKIDSKKSNQEEITENKTKLNEK